MPSPCLSALELGLSLIEELVTLNAVKGLFKVSPNRTDASGYPLGGRAFVQHDKRKSYIKLSSKSLRTEQMLHSAEPSFSMTSESPKNNKSAMKGRHGEGIAPSTFITNYLVNTACPTQRAVTIPE